MELRAIPKSRWIRINGITLDRTKIASCEITSELYTDESQGYFLHLQLAERVKKIQFRTIDECEQARDFIETL